MINISKLTKKKKIYKRESEIKQNKKISKYDNSNIYKEISSTFSAVQVTVTTKIENKNVFPLLLMYVRVILHAHSFL